MSNRTMNNTPLPTIGSQNWGATLNNYLRTQHYEHAELQEELNNLYEQSTNTIQTVLSSGILARNIESQRPGLYASDQTTYIEDGTQILSDAGSYCGFKGYGVIIGGANFTDILHNGEADDNKSQLKITKEVVDAAFTSSETYDARCVYAYYNNTSKFWEVKFSSELTDNNSISLNPYYICLGVIIKWSTNYYWHYKTMKANLSISSKKWMLDEPHAMLNTYISVEGNANSMTFAPFADSNFPKATLTVQALGIHPFTTYESGSNELSADIKQWNLNAYNAANNFQFIVLYKNKNDVIAPISTSGDTSTAITNLSSNATYRLCATAVTIAGKPLLILQKAYSGEGVSKSLFDEDEFGKILYFTDPVELYRLSINSTGNITMTAAVGNGISTVNANGINPHVTTLIKHADGIRFGEGDSKNYFHFNTQNITYPSNYEITIPVPTSRYGAAGTILTNTMESFDGNITISTAHSSGNRGIVLQAGVNNEKPILYADKPYEIRLHAKKDSMHYAEIDIYDDNIDPKTGMQIEHYLTDGGKDAIIHQKGTGELELTTRHRIADSSGTTRTTARTGFESSVIILGGNDYGEEEDKAASPRHDYSSIKVSTNTFSIKETQSANDLVTVLTSEKKMKITNPSDTSKIITFNVSGDKPEILLGGGGTKLSSDGLYFPSSSSGIAIDTIQGKGVSTSASHKFYNVGVDHLIAWTNGGATDSDSLISWEVAGKYSQVSQCKGAMADLYGRNDKDPWNFNPQGYFHYFWFRNPSEDETTISTDQPPALNEGDSITISYFNSAGSPVYKTYGDWAVVGDKHGRYGYIKEGGQIMWTIILSTTPSVITGLLAPKLNKALHVKNYFLCGLISSTALDLDAYGGDVMVSVNHHCTPLMNTGKLSKASATISSMADYSYINIDTMTDNSNVGIRKVNEGSWVSISDSFSGSLYMYGCSDKGSITALTNNGKITINKNNSLIRIPYLDNVYYLNIYKNVIFAGTVDANTRTAVTDAVAKFKNVHGKDLSKKFWYYRSLPASSSDRENSVSQLTVRRYFDYSSEEKDKQDTKIICLPELRKYTITIEILDDMFSQAWGVVRKASGNVDPLNDNTWTYSIPNVTGSLNASVQIVPHEGHFQFKVTYDKWYGGTVGNWCALVTITEDSDQSNYVLRQLNG